MDPRRLSMKRFIRYNIHENEAKRWALDGFENYAKVYKKAERMGHGDGDSNLFCENYHEENQHWQEKTTHFVNLFRQNQDAIVAVGDAAMTAIEQEGAEVGMRRFKDRVAILTYTDIGEAKDFASDVYHKFWAEQIKCYKEKNGEDQDIEHLEKYVLGHTVQGKCPDSLKCSMNMFNNRIRTW
jgi:hypothetical protein